MELVAHLGIDQIYTIVLIKILLAIDQNRAYSLIIVYGSHYTLPKEGS